METTCSSELRLAFSRQHVIVFQKFRLFIITVAKIQIPVMIIHQAIYPLQELLINDTFLRVYSNLLQVKYVMKIN
jgi:hypothetical protein